MPLVAQLSLTALGLLLFYLLFWRRFGFTAERAVARGTILYDKGDFGGALKVYRSARQRAPKIALAWECEGLACVMLDMHDDAAIALGHALRLQPKPVRQAHAYMALALARDGQGPKALEAIGELMPLLDETRARADAPILADAARAAAGDDAVCEAMTAIVRRLPSVRLARLLRGEAEWRRGRPGAALDDAVASREAEPRRARILEALARAELGELAAAKKASRDFVEALPPAFRARLARDPDAARAVQPADPEEVIQRALALFEGADAAGAARALDEAIALEAEDRHIRTFAAFRAMVRAELPSGFEAVTAREKLALARAAERSGEDERARKLRREAAELDPAVASRGR
ncbi:MAG: hypothetical protein HYY06_30780 [Deltaproteobacteria bacterium]|nr:hypothetical protein [Deltaproteobacteria bacterium]